MIQAGDYVKLLRDGDNKIYRVVEVNGADDIKISEDSEGLSCWWTTEENCTLIAARDVDYKPIYIYVAKAT